MNRSVIIDKDRSIGYEVNSPTRRALNAVFIPFLNLLPAGIQPLLRKTHKSADDIAGHATTHKALEVLYGYGSSRKPGNPMQRFFRSIWMNTNNSKAVRNRLKLVKREIKAEISKLAAENKEVKILSIASGSARAVLESIDELHFDKDARLSATFVDKNHDAISYSQELAGEHKYRALFEWYEETASNFFSNYASNKSFNIVEMVGLMDYFNDEKAIRMFSNIYRKLDFGGVLITANISDNLERRFITNVVGWRMIYRSAAELASVLAKSGFSRDKMKILYEPQRIHCVIMAEK